MQNFQFKTKSKSRQITDINITSKIIKSDIAHQTNVGQTSMALNTSDTIAL